MTSFVSFLSFLNLHLTTSILYSAPIFFLFYSKPCLVVSSPLLRHHGRIDIYSRPDVSHGARDDRLLLLRLLCLSRLRHHLPVPPGPSPHALFYASGNLPLPLYRVPAPVCVPRLARLSVFSRTLGFYRWDPALTAPGSPIGTFLRPTDSGGNMHCYFCHGCGVRLLHAVVLPDGSIRPKVSVKSRSTVVPPRTQMACWTGPAPSISLCVPQ